MSYIPPGHENDYISSDNFDYRKAAEDLWDAGCNHPDEIWGYTTKRGASDILSEYGLSSEKYKKKTTQKKEEKFPAFLDIIATITIEEEKTNDRIKAREESTHSKHNIYGSSIKSEVPRKVPDGYPMKEMLKNCAELKFTIRVMAFGGFLIFWRETLERQYGSLNFYYQYGTFADDITILGMCVIAIGFIRFCIFGKSIDNKYGKEHMVPIGKEKKGFSILIRLAIAGGIFFLSALPVVL